MNLTNVILAYLSFTFVMIGADKFLNFLEPPCSLMGSVPPLVWSVLGVLQIITGVLLWMPKYRKYLAGFWMVFMFIFTVVHLSQSTTDYRGALIMGVILGLLVWNPNFIKSKTSDIT